MNDTEEPAEPMQFEAKTDDDFDVGLLDLGVAVPLSVHSRPISVLPTDNLQVLLENDKSIEILPKEEEEQGDPIDDKSDYDMDIFNSKEAKEELDTPCTLLVSQEIYNE